MHRQMEVSTTVSEGGVSRSVTVAVILQLELDALVRELTASALVSRSKPKQASCAHGAVRLQITGEAITEL